MRTKAWLDGLTVGDCVALGRNRWDKNKVTVTVVRVEIVDARRVLHLSDGNKFPHSLGDTNPHRSGQKRTWIGPCK